MSIGEYIVLLNNDVQVFEHWLTDMKDVLDKFGYDLVMAHPMYSKTEPFARAVEAKKIREQAKASSQNQLSTFRDFSCVMFKRSLIEEIGMFDEAFFSYCSDGDFIKRMEGKGKKWICANYVATSHISDATGYSMPDTPKIMDKDKETYRLKWEKLEQTAKLTPVEGEWSPPVVTQKKEGILVRSDYTGDAIFLKGKDGKYHHIINPEVLHALGYDFGQDEVIDSINPIGEDITMDNYKNYE